MGLFDKRKKSELPPLITDEELDESLVNYNTVLDWLVGLNDKDYEKVLKVANIYRNANKDASTVLGIKDEATTSIFERQELEPVIIDKEPQFLEMDEPKKKPKGKIAKS